MAVPDVLPPSALPTAALQALLGASSDWLIALDADGRIAWSNGRLERACGQAPGTLQGRSLRALLGLAAGAPLAIDDHPWTAPGGAPRRLCLRTPGPQLLAIQDLTEARQLAAEARRLAEAKAATLRHN